MGNGGSCEPHSPLLARAQRPRCSIGGGRPTLSVTQGMSARSKLISRRAFLQGSALLAGGAAFAAAHADMGIDSAAGRIVDETVRVTVPDLPKAFDGYRIAFFTDIHLGIWVPDEWVAWGLEKLRAHSPDLLVLGGDYILANDNPVWPMLGLIRNDSYAGMDSEDAVPLMFATAAKILSSYSPPDGIVAVVGNHERWNSIDLFYDAFRRYPAIRVLVNEELLVRRGSESLLFFGSDDYLTGLPAVPPAATIPGVSARVLVTHNPDYVSEVLKRDAAHFSLALCGHTHGGQVRLPGLVSMAAPVRDTRFLSGLVQVDGRWVYTSRGLGVVGLPFRVNCPPEITTIELKSG